MFSGLSQYLVVAKDYVIATLSPVAQLDELEKKSENKTVAVQAMGPKGLFGNIAIIKELPPQIRKKADEKEEPLPDSAKALKKLLKELDQTPEGRNPFWILKQITTPGIPLFSQAGVGGSIHHQRQQIARPFNRHADFFAIAEEHFQKLLKESRYWELPLTVIPTLEPLMNQLFSTILNIHTEILWGIKFDDEDSQFLLKMTDFLVDQENFFYFMFPKFSYLHDLWQFYWNHSANTVQGLRAGYQQLINKWRAKGYNLEDENLLSIALGVAGITKLIKESVNNVGPLLKASREVETKLLDTEDPLKPYSANDFSLLHRFYIDSLSHFDAQPLLIRYTAVPITYNDVEIPGNTTLIINLKSFQAQSNFAADRDFDKGKGDNLPQIVAFSKGDRSCPAAKEIAPIIFKAFYVAIFDFKYKLKLEKAKKDFERYESDYHEQKYPEVPRRKNVV